ncbi:TPR Domain containing protein, partial [Aphelenchoides avenae]
MTKNTVVESVRKLRELELFDDLVLFAELNNVEQRIAENLTEEELAFVLTCTADAHYELAAYAPSIRLYERAQKILTTPRGPKATSGLVNLAQLRYKLHQAYLKENCIDDAIKCLESITEKDSLPKVRCALAKLLLRNKRSTKAISMPNQKVNRLLEAVVKDVPEALFCRSYLVRNNVPHEAPTADVSDECRAWLKAKEAEAHHHYTEAASILDRTPCTSIRYVLEMANFYHLAGNRVKAVASYQRAQSLDASNATGMDTLALLLYKEGQRKDLESLAGILAHCGTSCPEMFVAFGYLARLQHRMKEALQFAYKAATVASTEKQRSAAMLLKANMLLDSKRFKEADVHFHEALGNDRHNIDAFEALTRSLLMQ